MTVYAITDTKQEVKETRGPIPRLGVTPGVKICTIEFLG